MAHQIFSLISIIIVFVIQSQDAHCAVKFTKVICDNFDETFMSFPHCFVKAVNRTFNYAAVKVFMNYVPINDITLRFELLKRESGYKPFLYNIYFDVCKFLKNPRNPIALLAYKAITANTDMQRTCPLSRASMFWNVSNVSVEKSLLGLPYPAGDYAVFTTWATNNVSKLRIRGYMTAD